MLYHDTSRGMSALSQSGVLCELFTLIATTRVKCLLCWLSPLHCGVTGVGVSVAPVPTGVTSGVRFAVSCPGCLVCCHVHFCRTLVVSLFLLRRWTFFNPFMYFWELSNQKLVDIPFDTQTCLWWSDTGPDPVICLRSRVRRVLVSCLLSHTPSKFRSLESRSLDNRGPRVSDEDLIMDGPRSRVSTKHDNRNWRPLLVDYSGGPRHLGRVLPGEHPLRRL